MNYVTQSFQEFSSNLGPRDLALYAGVSVVLWVLFKDKLSPVQKLLAGVVPGLKQLVSTSTQEAKKSSNVVSVFSSPKKDVFFDLVSSWKQTRDLAVQSGCDDAVKVADQMFPFLSPQNCSEKKL